MIDLNELVMFVQVVDAKSFTQAARILDVPLSTLSRRLNLLEKRLGVRLLQRTTRKLQLTELGEVYYSHCKRVIEEADQAEQAIRNLQAEPTGTLKVAAPFGFDHSFTDKLVSTFLKSYPKVNLEFVQTTRNVDLIEERFDCAIRMGPQSDSSLVARYFGKADTVLCASPEYLNQHGMPERVEDLKHHEGIVLELLDWGWQTETGFQKLYSNFRVKTNDIVMARQLCIAGCGIAFIPITHCLEYLATGTLVQILPEVRQSIEIYLVYPSQRQISAKLRCFIDHQVELCREEAPWDFPR